MLLRTDLTPIRMVVVHSYLRGDRKVFVEYVLSIRCIVEIFRLPLQRLDESVISVVPCQRS